MIRKSALSRAHQPLYRQIIRDAFASAWKNRMLWPLALFAMILQSGGIMDAIFYTIDSLSGQIRDSGSSLMWAQVWGILTSLFRATNATQFLTSVSAVQNLVIALIFLVAILGMSVISQGGLVFALGRVFRGQKPNLHESLKVGAHAFQPIALVNLLSYAFMWSVTSLLMLPTTSYLVQPTVGNILWYALTLILYVILAILTTTVHLFALNAIIFEQATLSEALRTGFNLLRRHWLIIVELSGLLLLIGFGLLIGGFVTFLVAGIPLFLFMAVFNLLGTETLFYITYLLTGLSFIIIMLCAGACHITVQYATWERLYQRTVSSTPLAKIHRWMNWLFHRKAT